MARRRSAGWSRSFKKDAQLEQYYLDEVVPTDKTLGVGSYGSVVEVKYKQVSCAAKKMHEILLNPGNEGVQEIIRKYRQECQLMASLRHPNITQFLGLCFLEESELPLLVMEKLEMSVDDLLECAPNIQLPVKLSILSDTCSGLVYLHGLGSPIVHRDLTARNVLLTASLSAKITDMGNSRIVNLTPDQLAQTLSKNPGTTVYMPPEALSDSHRYGPSLDIFSFGHLSLYILTQVFPGNLLSATQVDPHNRGVVVGRSEVNRREVYMKKLENQFLESIPNLVELVTYCLDNDPQVRPSAEQLLGRLQSVSKGMMNQYGENLGKTMNTANVLQTMEIKQKEKLIRELQISQVKLETENAELIETNTKLENDKRSLESAYTQISRENNQLKTENHQLETENNLFKAEINKLQPSKSLQECEQLKLHYEQEKLHLETRHQEEKNSLQLEVERLTKELQGTKLSDVKKTADNSMPTYQIPAKLQRQQSGDMYTVPARKSSKKARAEQVLPMYSVVDKSKKKDEHAGLVYADIDVKNHVLRPKRPPPPPGVTRYDPNSVVYSVVDKPKKKDEHIGNPVSQRKRPPPPPGVTEYDVNEPVLYSAVQ